MGLMQVDSLREKWYVLVTVDDYFWYTWVRFFIEKSHLRCAKRILKYVIGIVEFYLSYSFDITVVLIGYCNADWAGCAEDRKSTSGPCFFLGNNLIAWFNKK